MLEGSQLLGLHGRTTQFGILGLLDVCQQLLLSLSTLERAILLGVHSQLEQLFVVLTVVPTILVHLLLEALEGIGDEGMGVVSGELTLLLLSQLDELGIDGARHLAALAQDHTPDGIVHHYIATLALLDGQQVHQRNVLRVLRERSYQWGIAHLWPYILYLVEQLHQHVVHRERRLALLLAQLVDHRLDRTKVGHHRTHHATRQTAT